LYLKNTDVFALPCTLGRGATITQNRLWVRYPQFATLTLQGANTGGASLAREAPGGLVHRRLLYLALD
jgi:hypothetical protein